MARDGLMTLFNLDDAKLWPITADTASVYTLGTGVDIPGIQSITMQPEFLTKELPGDARIIDYYSKFRKLTGSVRHAQLSLAVLEQLSGGSVADSGTSPNEKRTFTWSGSNLPKYIKLEAQVKYLGSADAGGSGDFHLTIFKAKMSNFQVELQNEDYAVVSFDYEAIPTNFDDKVIEMVENETAEAISVSVDTTPPTVSSSSPADGDTGVLVGANVTFTLSEEMQLASMSADNFFLVEADGSSVAFAFSYSQGTKTATLNPSSNLDASTVYVAGVTTGARDLAGNKLAAQHVINFTTA